MANPMAFPPPAVAEWIALAVRHVAAVNGPDTDQVRGAELMHDFLTQPAECWAALAATEDTE